MNQYPDDGSLIELARSHGSLRSLAARIGVSRVSLTNYLLRRPVLDRSVRVVLTSRARPVQLSSDHKSSIHPDLPNKPGKTNWVEQEGGLPPFIKRVAKHIMADSGYTESRAIAAAISQCKKGRLGPKGLAAAAQWEAMKASAHSHTAPAVEAIELATYSSQQLASAYGKPAGGQTKTTKGKAAASAGGKKKKIVRTAEGAKRYKVPIGSEIGSARNADAAKAQQNPGAVDKYHKTVGAKDRDAQVKALNNNELGQLSQVAFSFRSSDPNVVALRSSVVGQLRSRGMDPAKFGYLGGGAKPAAGKSAAKAPVRKAAVAAKKPAPKKPAAPASLGPHKSYPGAVRVR